MLRAPWPQHTPLLITLSPCTMPKLASSFRLVNWPTGKKKQSQDKYAQLGWYGETSIYMGYCNITRSNLPQVWKTICSLTLCSPESMTVEPTGRPRHGLGLWPLGPLRTLTLEHQFSYHNNTSMKSLIKMSGHWISDHAGLWGHREKTCIFLLLILKRSLDVCSSYSYWAHDHKYYSVYSGTVLLGYKPLWGLQNLQWSYRSASERYPAQKSWSAPGPTRVTLFVSLPDAEHKDELSFSALFYFS